MKKTISVIMAAAMLASSAVAFSSFADGAEGTGEEEKTYSDYVLNCGDEKLSTVRLMLDIISLTASSTSLIVLIPRKKESSGRAEDMRAAPLRKRQSS